MARKPRTLQQIADETHVEMSLIGRSVLTGGPVDRLPPRLWEELRLALQKCYRDATGEEYAVLTVTLEGEQR